MKHFIPNQIKKANKLTLAMGLLLFIILSSCSSALNEILPEEEPGIVYLAVTRAQGLSASINQNVTDFEDRVHNLAMLVFDSNTGKLITNYFETAILQEEVSKTFQIKLSPGKRDFYFIANSSLEELEQITDQSEIEAYLSKLNELPQSLFLGASASLGFPMSAIYLNQKITVGGTEQSPKPFRPNNNNVIYLIRAVSKIELHLKGIAPEQLKSVEYLNGATQYSLVSIDKKRSSIEAIKPMSASDNSTLYKLYVPELLLAKNTIIEEENQINSIKITLKNGKNRQIPIVSNGESFTRNYLDFALGQEKDNPIRPDYAIYRNKNYKLKVNNMTDASKIEVSLQVLPWIHQFSQFDFDTPEYSVEVTPNSRSQIIELQQQEKAKVKFKLKYPAGALWQASVTNGLYFNLQEVPEEELQADEVSGFYGIATTEKSYVFYVYPSQPYDYTTKYSELYITVNKKEVPLYISSNTEEGSKNNRYIFKQVE